ncbi:MAG: hypothetical protein HZB44_02895 [Actinobacteria bacterium]|nr:hypothetical protein [Actinomycetota bacterium]
MKAGNPYGSGPRGMLMVAVAVIMAVGLILVWGGCGGDGKEASTGSQLDDESVGSSSTGTSTVRGTGSANGSGTNDSNQGNVMVDYTLSQCIADMTVRYGDAATAQRVCNGIQADYSTATISELPTVLPQVETEVSATPLPGSTIPGTGGSTGGTGNTGGNTGGNTDNSGSGWDSGGIEIVVPPSP